MLFNPAAEKDVRLSGRTGVGSIAGSAHAAPGGCRAHSAMRTFGATGVTSRRMGAWGTILACGQTERSSPSKPPSPTGQPMAKTFTGDLARHHGTQAARKTAVAAAAEEEQGPHCRDPHDGLGQQLGGAFSSSDLVHRDLKTRSR